MDHTLAAPAWRTACLLLVALLLAGVAGCTIPNAPSSPDAIAEAPTASAPTSATPASPPTEPPSDAPASLTPQGELVEAQVVHVVDGDTLDVLLNGQEERLRLIGMDTPETVHPSRPVECFGREASDRAKALLEGQTVRLEADPSQSRVDRYGRLLRYVWLPDGRMFNYEMIRQGYAFEYTYNNPYAYQQAFQEAQSSAREQQRGLWAPQACAGERRPANATPQPMSPTAAPATPPPDAAADACDPAYPDVCIPSPPPDLDCSEIEPRRFRVLPPDPHNFDGNSDGVGCEGS
jgi:micrococcal nuclease